MGKQERKSTGKTVSDSARKIWLAGLGAFAKAQAEGSRLFEQLIREGTELDEKTRKYTKGQLKQMRETMERSTERLLATGRSAADRIQGLVDRRVADAVERMAVPTQEELKRLADQLEALGARLEAADDTTVAADLATPSRRHTGKSAARTTRTSSSARTATAGTSARKTAAKKVAAKKSAAKAPAAKKTASKASTKAASKATKVASKRTSSTAAKRGSRKR